MKAYNKAISTGLKLRVIKAFSCPFSSVFFLGLIYSERGTPLLGKERGLSIAKQKWKLSPFHNVLVPVFLQEGVCFPV